MAAAATCVAANGHDLLTLLGRVGREWYGGDIRRQRFQLNDGQILVLVPIDDSSGDRPDDLFVPVRVRLQGVAFFHREINLHIIESINYVMIRHDQRAA